MKFITAVLLKMKRKIRDFKATQICTKGPKIGLIISILSKYHKSEFQRLQFANKRVDLFSRNIRLRRKIFLNFSWCYEVVLTSKRQQEDRRHFIPCLVQSQWEMSCKASPSRSTIAFAKRVTIVTIVGLHTTVRVLGSESSKYFTDSVLVARVDVFEFRYYPPR